MKIKQILLVVMCLGFITNGEAQLLKKLKKRAEKAAERTILNKTDEKVSKTTEKTIDDATTKKDHKNKKESNEQNSDIKSANVALHKNTNAKQEFYKADLEIKIIENGTLNQTQYFDADEVAVKSTQDNMSKPSYIDSEGYIYTFNDGAYTKTALVALQSQGLMVPTMMLEAYKLPPEPFMAQYQKQTDLGMTANPFNGIVEFAFIYKPDDFRYEDYKESTQIIRGETYTKFELLNEPDYQGNYVLFDVKNRLTKVYSNKLENLSSTSDMYSMSMIPPGKSLLVYNYTPVEVQLPQAREVTAAGQELMEGVMGNIVKGGNQPKEDIDEDDYDTSEEKGMTKSVKKSLKNHKITVNDLPESYDFDWQLEAEMALNTRKKEVMDMIFLIKEGAMYQATQIAQKESKDMGNSTMLFDSNLNSMVMFMEAQGQKLMQIHPIPETTQNNSEIDYKITELASKTILGFNCKGIQLEDDKYILKVYHATNAPVTLSNFLSFSGDKNMELPDIDPKILSQFSNGLILEMDMIDKKKSKNNVNIVAKSLKNKKTSIEKADYQTMDFFSGAQMLKKN
ncbi:hypothetical protein [Psychroserpens mesophilus]|uniref:hypothetical protein n=1 Tax=Psychroserpens mesophilus TaxID=325473 RepID=UPI003D64FA3C